MRCKCLHDLQEHGHIARYMCARFPTRRGRWKLAAFLGLVLCGAENSVCLFIAQRLNTKDLCPHKICYYPSDK